MATWVTHIMIADHVIKQCPNLDKSGFYVGNIAPDCNVENEDWTSFTPSREVTHWMSGERKVASDGDLFCEKYILTRKNDVLSSEHYSFLLGYYAHLITDAAFDRFVRDDERIQNVWHRIKADENLRERAAGLIENWDSAKKLIPKNERLHEIFTMEAEYLHDHPDSGYSSEIMQLKVFPDYIDYLPHGCIVRIIGVMGYLPTLENAVANPISISREELHSFVGNTTSLIVQKFCEADLI